jgi:hypothetical protein
VACVEPAKGWLMPSGVGGRSRSRGCRDGEPPGEEEGDINARSSGLMKAIFQASRRERTMVPSNGSRIVVEWSQDVEVYVESSRSAYFPPNDLPRIHPSRDRDCDRVDHVHLSFSGFTRSWRQKIQSRHGGDVACYVIE